MMKFFSSTKEFIDCKIIAIPGRYDYKPIAFGYQLNSPYAGVLDYHIKLTRRMVLLIKSLQNTKVAARIVQI